MKNGIWDQWTADKYHQSSIMLAQSMDNTFDRHCPVMDFGCGNAFYLHYLNITKKRQCVGVEGFRLNNFLHNNIVIHDLTKPIDLGMIGNVISLEVGEHLPKSAEQTYLNTICGHCNDWLVMSWALPLQPGIGHINCQPQEYIREQIESRGLTYRDDTTKYFRERIDENTDWFRRTLMVFQR